MKKTIIALLALGGVAAAGEAITLGSYYTSNGTTYCTVDTFNGKTEAEIAVFEGQAADANVCDRFSSGTYSLSVNTGDLYQFAGSATTGDVLKLTSFAMTSQMGNQAGIADHQAAHQFAKVTVGEKAYTTKVYMTSTWDSTTPNVAGILTFDFSGENVIFKMGDTITFNFDSDNGNVNSAVPSFQNINGPVIASNMPAWKASVKISAVSVPEPTTATLSLLALAGLAARRRRK